MLNRRSIFLLAVATGLVVFVPVRAHAQRRQPSTRFESSDFQQLRWLEGRWMGTTDGESPFYEQYHFQNDSTLVVTYYADAGFTRRTGGAKVYLSVEHLYQTAGPARWAATRVTRSGIYFVPLVNSAASYDWTYVSPNEWTSTMRSGASGRERTTVYHMHRVR